MNSVFRKCLSLLPVLGLAASSGAAPVFVEAESFAQPGGWMLDTQFVEIMGSPYLLAHGMGRPVADATTTVKIPEAGSWHVHVRTKDWVAAWKAPGAPGRFQLVVNGKPLETTFGTTGADWHWQSGGAIQLPAGEVTLALHDLTGFDGRCDAICLTQDATPPPAAGEALLAFRKKALGLPAAAPETKEYDLVVCGGGYSGMGAAISAARQGLKVALLQNRPVLGGNGSSEIRVWAQGGTRRGLYPNLGEIVDEFADRATNSPGLADEYGDALKEKLVRSEKNIDLFLNHHARSVEMEPGERKVIRSVTALDTKSGSETRFRAKLFSDCTGHGTIGALAGASFTMLEKGHMGMSNMWYLTEGEKAAPFAKPEWALPLEMGDFPPPKKSEKSPTVFQKGEWFWEGGFDKHPINDLELVRDWNLRAVFGAFNALKNGPEAAKYEKTNIEWVAGIGGTRESRLLQGDVVLQDTDIIQKKEFPDGCVPTTWDLDLHYPKEQFAKKFPEAPFISMAKFGKGVDRQNGYPVPYRCFYSKDVENLFMAGRCLSATHEALGTVRVMKTCGMMGEVVGKAAYLCIKEKTSPRGVYQSHLEKLKDLFRQPGSARRDSLDAPLVVPPGTPELPHTGSGLDPKKLEGLVLDDTAAKLTGSWTEGTGLKGYIGLGYRYASAGSGASARFEFTPPKAGTYEVRVAWQPHVNRATAAPVELAGKTFTLDQTKPAELKDGFHSLGRFDFPAGTPQVLTLGTAKAGGAVHLDAVQVVEVK